MKKIEISTSVRGGYFLKQILEIILVLILITVSFCMGNYLSSSSSAAVYGQLEAAGDTYTVEGQSSSITIKRNGTYKIECWGGASGRYGNSTKGGHIAGTTTFQKGQVVNINFYTRGTVVGPVYFPNYGYTNLYNYTTNIPNNSMTNYNRYYDLSYMKATKGGDAIIVSVNGTYLIGAGGAGGSYYYGATSKEEDLYGHPLPKTITIAGQAVSSINNASFSPGANGYANYCTSSVGYGLKNPSSPLTISGATAAASPTGNNIAAQAGSNYLNTGKVSLTSQPNDSTLSTAKVVITAITTELDVTDTYPAVISQAGSVNRIATILENGPIQEVARATDRQTAAIEKLSTVITNSYSNSSNSNNEAPDIIVVISGKAFDEYIKGDDTTTGGTNQGVTVINNDTNDGYVRIVGVLIGSGNKEIVIDNIKYIFKIIEEPNSSNVSVLLN